MSDLYKEHLVKKKQTASDKMMRVLLIGGTVLLGLAGILLYPIFLVGALAMGICAYIFLPGTDLEYEYLLVNRSLDIDKVMAKTKRKRVRSFDLSGVDIIAPLNSHRLDYYNQNSNIKVLDYSSGEADHKRFAFIISEEGNLSKVIFEPDEEMASLLRQSMPSKVFLD